MSSEKVSSGIMDDVLAPTEFDPDVAKYTDPFYKISSTGKMEFRDSAVAKLFRDTTAGTPEEVARILSEEGISGIMRRILTDSNGVIRAAILAKAMKEGMRPLGGKAKRRSAENIAWLRLATKIISTTIDEGANKNGKGVSIGAGAAVAITEPIRGLLREVEGEG